MSFLHWHLCYDIYIITCSDFNFEASLDIKLEAFALVGGQDNFFRHCEANPLDNPDEVTKRTSKRNEAAIAVGVANICILYITYVLYLICDLYLKLDSINPKGYGR
jgi:hypothetical protein